MIRAFVTAFCVVMCAQGASAQFSLSGRTTTIVIPFGAGGSIDLLGRIVAREVGPATDQTIIVENIAGASGDIGVNSVARAPADGRRMLLHNAANLLLTGILNPAAPFKPMEDFIPVTSAVEVQTVIAAHRSAPFDTFAGFLQYAAKNPGQLSYGSNGIGTSAHLEMALLEKNAGIQLLHVPYSGGAGALKALIQGELDLVIIPAGNAVPEQQKGALKALVRMRPQPAPDLDVPFIGDVLTGMPRLPSSFGFFLRKGTPEAIVARWNEEIVKVLNRPDVRSKLEAAGLNVVASTAAAYNAEFVRGHEAFLDAVRIASVPRR